MSADDLNTATQVTEIWKEHGLLSKLSSREKKELAGQIADSLIQVAEQGLGLTIENRQKLHYDLKKPLEVLSNLPEAQRDFAMVCQQLDQHKHIWQAAFIAAMLRRPAICWAVADTTVEGLLELIPKPTQT